MQVSDRLISIASDAGGVLVVQRLPQNSSIGFVFAGLLLVAALVVFFLRRLPLGFLLLLLALVFAWIGRPGVMYRMTIDERAATIAWEGSRNGKVVEAEHVAAKDVVTADIQSGASGGRLMLLRRDGTAVYPLGSTALQSEPVLSVVTDRIKHLLAESH